MYTVGAIHLVLHSHTIRYTGFWTQSRWKARWTLSSFVLSKELQVSVLHFPGAFLDHVHRWLLLKPAFVANMMTCVLGQWFPEVFLFDYSILLPILFRTFTGSGWGTLFWNNNVFVFFPRLVNFCKFLHILMDSTSLRCPLCSQPCHVDTATWHGSLCELVWHQNIHPRVRTAYFYSILPNFFHFAAIKLKMTYFSQKGSNALFKKRKQLTVWDLKIITFCFYS